MCTTSYISSCVYTQQVRFLYIFLFLCTFFITHASMHTLLCIRLFTNFQHETPWHIATDFQVGFQSLRLVLFFVFAADPNVFQMWREGTRVQKSFVSLLETHHFPTKLQRSQHLPREDQPCSAASHHLQVPPRGEWHQQGHESLEEDKKK